MYTILLLVLLGLVPNSSGIANLFAALTDDGRLTVFEPSIGRTVLVHDTAKPVVMKNSNKIKPTVELRATARGFVELGVPSALVDAKFKFGSRVWFPVKSTVSQLIKASPAQSPFLPSLVLRGSITALSREIKLTPIGQKSSLKKNESQKDLTSKNAYNEHKKRILRQYSHPINIRAMKRNQILKQINKYNLSDSTNTVKHINNGDFRSIKKKVNKYPRHSLYSRGSQRLLKTNKKKLNSVKTRDHRLCIKYQLFKDNNTIPVKTCIPWSLVALALIIPLQDSEVYLLAKKNIRTPPFIPSERNHGQQLTNNNKKKESSYEVLYKPINAYRNLASLKYSKIINDYQVSVKDPLFTLLIPEVKQILDFDNSHKFTNDLGSLVNSLVEALEPTHIHTTFKDENLFDSASLRKLLSRSLVTTVPNNQSVMKDPISSAYDLDRNKSQVHVPYKSTKTEYFEQLKDGTAVASKFHMIETEDVTETLRKVLKQFVDDRGERVVHESSEYTVEKKKNSKQMSTKNSNIYEQERTGLELDISVDEGDTDQSSSEYLQFQSPKKNEELHNPGKKEDSFANENHTTTLNNTVVKSINNITSFDKVDEITDPNMSLNSDINNSNSYDQSILNKELETIKTSFNQVIYEPMERSSTITPSLNMHNNSNEKILHWFENDSINLDKQKKDIALELKENGVKSITSTLVTEHSEHMVTVVKSFTKEFISKEPTHISKTTYLGEKNKMLLLSESPHKTFEHLDSLSQTYTNDNVTTQDTILTDNQLLHLLAHLVALRIPHWKNPKYYTVQSSKKSKKKLIHFNLRSSVPSNYQSSNDFSTNTSSMESDICGALRDIRAHRDGSSTPNLCKVYEQKKLQALRKLNILPSNRLTNSATLRFKEQSLKVEAMQNIFPPDTAWSFTYNTINSSTKSEEKFKLRWRLSTRSIHVQDSADGSWRDVLTFADSSRQIIKLYRLIQSNSSICTGNIISSKVILPEHFFHSTSNINTYDIHINKYSSLVNRIKREINLCPKNRNCRSWIASKLLNSEPLRSTSTTDLNELLNILKPYCLIPSILKKCLETLILECEDCLSYNLLNLRKGALRINYYQIKDLIFNFNQTLKINLTKRGFKQFHIHLYRKKLKYSLTNYHNIFRTINLNGFDIVSNPYVRYPLISQSLLFFSESQQNGNFLQKKHRQPLPIISNFCKSQIYDLVELTEVLPPELPEPGVVTSLIIPSLFLSSHSNHKLSLKPYACYIQEYENMSDYIQRAKKASSKTIKKIKLSHVLFLSVGTGVALGIIILTLILLHVSTAREKLLSLVRARESRLQSNNDMRAKEFPIDSIWTKYISLVCEFALSLDKEDETILKPESKISGVTELKDKNQRNTVPINDISQNLPEKNPISNPTSARNSTFFSKSLLHSLEQSKRNLTKRDNIYKYNEHHSINKEILNCNDNLNHMLNLTRDNIVSHSTVTLVPDASSYCTERPKDSNIKYKDIPQKELYSQTMHNFRTLLNHKLIYHKNKYDTESNLNDIREMNHPDYPLRLKMSSSRQKSLPWIITLRNNKTEENNNSNIGKYNRVSRSLPSPVVSDSIQPLWSGIERPAPILALDFTPRTVKPGVFQQNISKGRLGGLYRQTFQPGSTNENIYSFYEINNRASTCSFKSKGTSIRRKTRRFSQPSASNLRYSSTDTCSEILSELPKSLRDNYPVLSSISDIAEYLSVHNITKSKAWYKGSCIQSEKLYRYGKNHKLIFNRTFSIARDCSSYSSSDVTTSLIKDSSCRQTMPHTLRSQRLISNSRSSKYRYNLRKNIISQQISREQSKKLKRKQKEISRSRDKTYYNKISRIPFSASNKMYRTPREMKSHNTVTYPISRGNSRTLSRKFNFDKTYDPEDFIDSIKSPELEKYSKKSYRNNSYNLHRQMSRIKKPYHSRVRNQNTRYFKYFSRSRFDISESRMPRALLVQPSYKSIRSSSNKTPLNHRNEKLRLREHITKIGSLTTRNLYSNSSEIHYNDILIESEIRGKSHELKKYMISTSLITSDLVNFQRVMAISWKLHSSVMKAVNYIFKTMIRYYLYTKQGYTSQELISTLHVVYRFVLNRISSILTLIDGQSMNDIPWGITKLITELQEPNLLYVCRPSSNRPSTRQCSKFLKPHILSCDHNPSLNISKKGIPVNSQQLVNSNLEIKLNSTNWPFTNAELQACSDVLSRLGDVSKLDSKKVGQLALEDSDYFDFSDGHLHELALTMLENISAPLLSKLIVSNENNLDNVLFHLYEQFHPKSRKYTKEKYQRSNNSKLYNSNTFFPANKQFNHSKKQNIDLDETFRHKKKYKKSIPNATWPRLVNTFRNKKDHSLKAKINAVYSPSNITYIPTDNSRVYMSSRLNATAPAMLFPQVKIYNSDENSRYKGVSQDSDMSIEAFRRLLSKESKDNQPFEYYGSRRNRSRQKIRGITGFDSIIERHYTASNKIKKRKNHQFQSRNKKKSQQNSRLNLSQPNKHRQKNSYNSPGKSSRAGNICWIADRSRTAKSKKILNLSCRRSSRKRRKKILQEFSSDLNQLDLISTQNSFSNKQDGLLPKYSKTNSLFDTTNSMDLPKIHKDFWCTISATSLDDKSDLRYGNIHQKSKYLGFNSNNAITMDYTKISEDQPPALMSIDDRTAKYGCKVAGCNGMDFSMVPLTAKLRHLLNNGQFYHAFNSKDFSFCGSGGQGVVMRAEHLLERRTYAIKAMLMYVADDDDVGQGKWLREVMANLEAIHTNSQHIVRYFTSWIEEPQFLPERLMAKLVSDRAGYSCTHDVLRSHIEVPSMYDQVLDMENIDKWNIKSGTDGSEYTSEVYDSERTSQSVGDFANSSPQGNRIINKVTNDFQSWLDNNTKYTENPKQKAFYPSERTYLRSPKSCNDFLEYDKLDKFNNRLYSSNSLKPSVSTENINTNCIYNTKPHHIVHTHKHDIQRASYSETSASSPTRNIQFKLNSASDSTKNKYINSVVSPETNENTKINYPVEATQSTKKYSLVLFIQMEYCSGLTLREWLIVATEKKQFPRWKISGVPIELLLAKQMARAVNDMHKAKVVHRDLKPENIFILWDQTVPGIYPQIGSLAGDETPVTYTSSEYSESEHDPSVPISIIKPDKLPSSTEVDSVKLSLLSNDEVKYYEYSPEDYARAKISARYASTNGCNPKWRFPEKLLLKIGDLGLAQVPVNPLIGSQTENGEFPLEHFIGTPDYRPPEILLTEKADIYSMGLVLCELCYHAMGDSTERTDIFDKIKNDRVVPETVKALSSSLETLILNMTEVNPDSRPSSQIVYSVLRHLVRSLTDKTIQTNSNISNSVETNLK